MDLHQLKVFHAAATTGSFTRAGERMSISQPTVSLHVRQLEAHLGCPLFARQGKRVALSEAGRLLAAYCEKIFGLVEAAELAVRELGGQEQSHLRFGTGATTLIHQLPPVLNLFRERHPGVELIVFAGTTETIVEQVKAQKLDLGLVMLPLSDRDLHATPLCAEELVVVVPDRHPLAGRRRLSVRHLAELQFILFDKQSAMGRLIDRYFADLGVAPRVLMEVENVEAIKSLVEAGLGASVLPEHAVSSQVSAGRLRRLRVAARPLRRQLGLVTLKSARVPRVAREMIELVLAELGDRPGERRAGQPGGSERY
jgi:LysR family transcriptional regulator, cyn operon transcriptional activator